MLKTPLSHIDLVLASTSRYRRDLLARITPQFRQLAPNVIEDALSGETPQQLASRLAEIKALAVAAQCSQALIIGSDQVASCAGHLLGKPGNHEQARRQLLACSGKSVDFYTGLCLADTRYQPLRCHKALDITRVVFRTLTPDEIGAYLAREQPYDCAGSFKVEGLGIGLFERIETSDPSALIGLPLIALCRLLREANITLMA